MTIEDTHPAGVAVILGFGLLPVEADLDPAEGIAPEFVGPIRTSFTGRADDEGAHRPGRGGPGIEAGARTVFELGTPRGVGGVGVETVAVAVGLGKLEEFGRE